MAHIAILASGNGTNAEAIIRHFAPVPHIATVELVAGNNANARVKERATRLGVPFMHIARPLWNQGDEVVRIMRDHGIDLIILAGFMVLVPKALVDAFPQRIINLHPALLPRHGGQGMYGHHVHEAVIADGDTTTGITIHLIDEHYDRGTTLFQASFDVTPQDTAATIEERIHQLEHQHYPEVIEQYIRDEHL